MMGMGAVVLVNWVDCQFFHQAQMLVVAGFFLLGGAGGGVASWDKELLRRLQFLS